MKPSETTEGSDDSVHTKGQPSISVYKSDTGSQSWAASTQYNRLKWSKWFPPFSQLHISQSISDILIKLSVTTEGSNDSVYTKLQPSITFYTSDTWSQSWDDSAQIQPISVWFAIFIALYLKMYLTYTNGTEGNYEGVACLCVY